MSVAFLLCTYVLCGYVQVANIQIISFEIVAFVYAAYTAIKMYRLVGKWKLWSKLKGPIDVHIRRQFSSLFCSIRLLCVRHTEPAHFPHIFHQHVHICNSQRQSSTSFMQMAPLSIRIQRCEFLFNCASHIRVYDMIHYYYMRTYPTNIH